ncbi:MULTISPECIES: homoserine O-acetyltransferase MetX [Haloarcula]|uniref:Homoserine O-acetyltransferase n=1 Tax=Haloarcula pellucida TaxID=1427151 RepID=A0A830GJ07_9EURY|nr:MULTISPECIES: homoserine O-acetyltransferase [Halomicroarcula]MBX0350452.1 homoserine O-acetyltransferase [Halomicroarcula pellucida]MDS0278708.1 homoserine O-acetyltransferase [Halomicroarcula sp. S1AR25-4]GGN91092.1 homoserine O-acetyltransferase [Halomicroarcula pellucida]
MTVESQTVSIGEFEFQCGETIPDLELAYETYGDFTGDNAVLVCHALTGSAHVASRGRFEEGDQAYAWWDDIVGPGKAIDTTEYFVVCVNVPGSCYGSSGPSSTNPETGEPWGPAFPPVTVADWTDAQRALLDELGIPALYAVVGGSVGGMNVLEWAKRHPDHVEKIVPIAAAGRLDPQCLALDGIARRAITTDPNWNGGNYYAESDGGEHPDHGLALAREIGHVMYFSKSSMERRFGRRAATREAERAFPTDPAGRFFPYRDVESYLDYNASKFVERFDANSYLYLTRAMDNYDLSSGFESDADALAAFDGEALVMSFTGDWHFTTQQSESLADALRETDTGVAHHVVDSDYGHDAFLVEPDSVGPPLSDFLEEGLHGNAVSDTQESEDEPSDFAPVHNSLFSR